MVHGNGLESCPFPSLGTWRLFLILGHGVFFLILYITPSHSLVLCHLSTYTPHVVVILGKLFLPLLLTLTGLTIGVNGLLISFKYP